MVVRLAALAIVVALATHLVRLWRRQPVDFSAVEPALFVAAAAATCLAVVSYGLVWPLILRRLEAEVPRAAVAIFLLSQLGKYLPGSVWHLAGRVALAKSHGVPPRTAIHSLAIEVLASGAAAGLVGLLVLPWTIALPVGLVVAAIVASARNDALRALLASVAIRVPRLRKADLGTTLHAVPSIVPLYVPVWVAYGLALWLTSRALFPTPIADFPYFTAAFALGWIAGMVVVFAPGGIGIREAMLVALLAPKVGEAEAIVLAGASRLLLTAADAAGGIVGFAVSRRLQPTQR